MTNQNVEGVEPADEPTVYEVTAVGAVAPADETATLEAVDIEEAVEPVDVVVEEVVETEAATAVSEDVVADSGVAAGWYPNPSAPNEERYWDGAVWTDQIRPLIVAEAVVAESGPNLRDAAGRFITDPTGFPVSPKSRTVAAILAFFLGGLGIHRFYVGKVGTGVAILAITVVTLGTLGWIWPLVDFIMILAGSFRDMQRRLLLNWS